MRRRVAVLTLALLALALVSVQTAGLGVSGYGIPWWTVDGGGETWSRGGGYRLGATIGQPDANVLEGGAYTLAGGFWSGGRTVEVEHRIYLPLLLRG